MRQSVQGKRIFPGGQNSFVPHFAKLFGKRTAVDIQIVRQPLSVKRNLKILPPGLTDRQAAARGSFSGLYRKSAGRARDFCAGRSVADSG